MNQAHLHLLINHLPVFASILGAFVLAQGLWTKTNQTIIAAYYLFIISALGAGVAYLTGEAAEEAVENLQGISKNIVNQHEDFAIYSLISLIILGAASAAGLFLTIKKSTQIKKIAVAILFISLISFGLVARTGYLGGQIRHTEINNSPSETQEKNGENDDND